MDIPAKTNMSKRKRNSYSIHTKADCLKWIETETEKNGMRPTISSVAEKFKIARSSVYDWIKQKEGLIKFSSF